VVRLGADDPHDAALRAPDLLLVPLVELPAPVLFLHVRTDRQRRRDPAGQHDGGDDDVGHDPPDASGGPNGDAKAVEGGEFAGESEPGENHARLKWGVPAVQPLGSRVRLRSHRGPLSLEINCKVQGKV